MIIFLINLSLSLSDDLNKHSILHSFKIFFLFIHDPPTASGVLFLATFLFIISGCDFI